MPTLSRPWLGVRLIERGATTLVPADTLKFSVKRFSRITRGGCATCSIEVYGTEAALWDLFNKLQCGVEVYDDLGDVVWNGVILDSNPGASHVLAGVSLQGMTNRIAVQYNQISGDEPIGGKATRTAWVEHANSIANYGYHESLVSIPGDASQSQAEAQRDKILALRALPTPKLRQGSERATYVGTLECGGWFVTANFRYYSNSDWSAINSPRGGLDYEILRYDESRHCAQSFQVTGGSGTVPWSIDKIFIKISRSGAGGYNVTVHLKADSGGNPGSSLDSVTIAASSIPSSDTTGLTFVEFVMPAKYTPTYGTTYWITVERSNAANYSDFCYVKATEDNVYTSGQMKVYDNTGGGWGNPPEGSGLDFKFKVVGRVETTTLISNIVTASCQYITTTNIKDVSGKYGTPYRDGTRKAWEEIETLLDAGDASGNPLLATVESFNDGATRVLKVYKQPAATDTTQLHRLDEDGTLRDPWGVIVPPYKCLCGVWVTLDYIVPAGVTLSSISTPSPLFIVSAEYDAESDTTQYNYAGMSDPYDLPVSVEVAG